MTEKAVPLLPAQWWDRISLAKRIARVVIESELDGIILIVPDYVQDLTAVARNTLTRMAEYGVGCRIGQI